MREHYLNLRKLLSRAAYGNDVGEDVNPGSNKSVARTVTSDYLSFKKGPEDAGIPAFRNGKNATDYYSHHFLYEIIQKGPTNFL